MEKKEIIKLIYKIVRKETDKRIATVIDISEKLTYTKIELAKTLSVSVRTIDRMRERGDITSVNSLEKGKVLFSKEEVKRFLLV